MGPKFSLKFDAFVIENYNESRPFSSFLPGIAGLFGKPMWVFYTNRGQCVSSFGIRNKNSSMVEFYPANKAYEFTPLLGFRTFIRFKKAGMTRLYEPFRVNAGADVRQILYVRPHEIELEETNKALGLRTRIVMFTVPNEDLPALVRQVHIENLGRQPFKGELLDGLPQIVPYGLHEGLLKQMSRTMEAFAETTHVSDKLPFFKLKTEPSDKPEVEWIHGGYFAFSFLQGVSLKVLVDPQGIFGADTSFQIPQPFAAGKPVASAKPRTESVFGCAFAHTPLTIPGRRSLRLSSYYGQADSWDQAQSFRSRIAKNPSFSEVKRQENTDVLVGVAGQFATHSSSLALDAYSRQSYLDNVLRGGQPVVFEDGKASQMFHAYARKHGDMERDYNFFELSPSYFSQGNGNFRDVNQNRRAETLLNPAVGAANIETFFNLIQLDGYNPLVTQSELFKVGDRVVRPGELFEERLAQAGSRESASRELSQTLARAPKIQEAVHGEGFWVDHWTYNLDLLESFVAVYPDEFPALLTGRKTFTYFDNDFVVQPRDKKYVQREDGAVRQMQAVVRDAEKTRLLRQRKEEPNKVRTQGGTGVVYHTTLLAKCLGLVAVKAASLDPFGMGLEMEADKPGWCDAMNGLPGLLGSSVNESFELLRWVQFLAKYLGGVESHAVPEELAQFIRSVGEALALARPEDFFKTWETLSSLRERFRENTRLGISGEERSLTRGEIATFLERVRKVLETGLARSFRPDGLCTTYYINHVAEFEKLPARLKAEEPEAAPVQYVRAQRFKQMPISPYLEGPMHALRVAAGRSEAQKVYRAVKNSALYDKKLKMYKLNVPLLQESYEIGRAKIFTPGWLENEAIFLHMHYKFLLELLRAGLAEEYFAEMKNGIVAFLSPKVYGRSPTENSSFIASSSFPDERLHGTGFVARLSGSTAEWLSMVFYMGFGAVPFHWENGELRFEPKPTIAKWLFAPKARNGFDSQTFAFKFLGKTWIVYHNPSRQDTYGPKAVSPAHYKLHYEDGKTVVHEGSSLPDAPARDLRAGKLTRLNIELR